MIGKTLQALLDEKDINVNELSKMINVSNQTLYSIIKRDNMKIDFEVLLKICKALNVSVEYFYADYIQVNKSNNHDDQQLNTLIELYQSLNDDNKKKLLELAQLYANSNNQQK